ncbi:MAG: DUF3047 domain-containing protein [Verrucomicrobia bacterium]|nr:DUF3047 domain-containing protein [Verrucomicrobiota bacterium]
MKRFRACYQRHMVQKVHAVLVLFTLLLWPACVAVAAAGPLFEENFSTGLSALWKPVDFTGRTQYTVVGEGTNAWLAAHAVKSASGLAREVRFKPAAKFRLTWRWKIDRCPPGGSEDVKATFDHTARIFIAFEARLGPPRTVNYVWANQLAVGATFNHPSSGRARFIVLQSGDAKAGPWQSESRDVAADWKKLFGDLEMPDLVGIGLMTDADGTAADVTGGYADFRLTAE